MAITFIPAGLAMIVARILLFITAALPFLEKIVVWCNRYKRVIVAATVISVAAGFSVLFNDYCNSIVDKFNMRGFGGANSADILGAWQTAESQQVVINGVSENFMGVWLPRMNYFLPITFNIYLFFQLSIVAIAFYAGALARATINFAYSVVCITLKVAQVAAYKSE